MRLADKIPQSESNDYKDVLRKDIYRVLAPNVDRDKAKRQFGRFAFGPYNRENQFGRNFSARFPILAKVIRSFPRDASEGRTLNCLLQDLEAEIGIYTVVKKCMEKNVFVVPVHDSFIIKPQSFEFVNSIVKEEFERRFNFRIDLKTKWEHKATGYRAPYPELFAITMQSNERR